MMYRRRPNARKQAQMVVVALVLAMATQLLLHQWGYGAELPTPGSEKFIGPSSGTGTVIELRSEAAVIGDSITLRQVARWSSADKTVMDPMADLVLTRFSGDSPFEPVNVERIKAVLRAAGMNIAVLNFTGATSCTVSRSDEAVDQSTALQKWADAKSAGVAAVPVRPVLAAEAPAVSDPPATKTLRDVLLNDIAERLYLPVESLQVRFDAQDDKLLRTSEPLFQVTIESRQLRDLGDVSWDVALINGATKKKATIKAYARAWQRQVVLGKAVAARQVIRDEDVIDKRTLADHVPGEPLAEKTEVVGQQAARDLVAGTVMTGRLVETVPLVHSGQLVTVIVESGRIQIKTVAEARETASFGQTIRVKKPGTDEEFNVVVTGPQTARATAISEVGAARPAVYKLDAIP